MVYLHKINKAKWQKGDNAWLADEELQADALIDLRTQGNNLSFFYIEGEEKEIQDIAVAMTLKNEEVSKFDYALINEEELNKLKLKFKKTDGDTPDDEINKLHFDVIETTAKNIIDIAYIIKKSKMDRIFAKTMTQNIITTLQKRTIDMKKVKLKPSELRKLGFDNIEIK